ncbi:Clp1/GlmU family protein [Arenibaculum sp.]|uniref:Clp1/GlmU family protein n=1 Tax=Arenibaculum sp. TaxID=2865862 RepID=UPI002E0D7A43|nr:Clp1/GlmU family protein [Arenibaculum sp.]
MAQTPAVDVPPRWADALAAVLDRGARTVLLLGATDTGKTSFCRFAASALADAGRTVAAVDADPGQKWIGPPATVGLGYPMPGRPDPPAVALGFVGSPDPAGHFLPLVAGTMRLVEDAAADLVLVNTAGLVTGPGRLLTDHLVEAVRPELIVAIERAGELAPLLDANRHVPALILAPSPAARRKSAARRRALRRAGFAAAFEGATTLAFDPRALALQRAASAPEPEPGASLLCAACDAGGRMLGLALLDRNGPPALRTAVPAPAVAVLQLGTLHLDAEFGEIRPRSFRRKDRSSARGVGT